MTYVEFAVTLANYIRTGETFKPNYAAKLTGASIDEARRYLREMVAEDELEYHEQPGNRYYKLF